jgi:NhaP-type Na+/H+ or K+/H+ antiporter
MIGLLDAVPMASLSGPRTLFELGLVAVLAAAAPLIGQVLRLPSILVLLALGFGAGALGALDPNALLGQQVISAFVSIAVGVILFEAGLGLKLSRLTGAAARVSRRLVTLGILVTWAIGTVAAYLLFDLSFEVALVLGAVLVVSGPTVVGPLLEFIRPSKKVNLVLKWEGTLADPVGATLGVVVFNAVLAGHAKAGQEVFQFLLNLGVGIGFGVAGAVLVLAWAAWFQPNQSQAVTGALMFVVAMVVCADLLRDDSGLITGLVTGAILVNRPPRGTEPQGVAIQRAKLLRSWRERIGTLTTFLIGILFIILSARVTPHQIAEVGAVSIAFVAVLVFLGRPLAVALSTFGSSLTWRERAFIAWMAPRGIVAAATSSTFALGFSQAGIGGGADDLIPITFIVIVATALIYGLTGAPVARALGVAHAGPGGVLLIGASPVGRAIGRVLKSRGVTVVLWTADEDHARAAQGDGLALYTGDPTQDATETVPSELDEVHYALAVGEDEALNAMVAADLSEYFGRERVFQLPVSERRAAAFLSRVPILFDGAATHAALLSRIEAGDEISVAEPAAAAGGNDRRADLGANGIAMFVLTPGKELRIVAAGDRTEVHEGQELIGLHG